MFTLTLTCAFADETEVVVKRIIAEKIDRTCFINY
jgi:hypothetical protein